MRSRFDHQLSILNEKLTELGTHCQAAISLVAQALTGRGTDSLDEIAHADQAINQLEREIEALCIKLLLQQQPVARDLRQISAALKMVTDMERIGDQAEDIAEILPQMNQQITTGLDQLCEMADATIRMVTDSVAAYVQQDASLAEQVIAYDDVVDECFLQMKRSLIEVIANNPKEGEHILDLLMIAKYFERIGDHAVNIAEWVRFAIYGHHSQ